MVKKTLASILMGLMTSQAVGCGVGETDLLTKVPVQEQVEEPKTQANGLIYFLRDDENGIGQIHSVDPENLGDSQKLTFGDHAKYELDISKDGTKLLYRETQHIAPGEQHFQVYEAIIGAKRIQEIKPITPNDMEAIEPTYFENRIVVSARNERNKWNLYSVKSDREVERLTTSNEHHLDAAECNGSLIYVSDDVARKIKTIDGQEIIEENRPLGNPQCSDEGEIFYHNLRGSAWEVAMVNPENGYQTNVTEGDDMSCGDAKVSPDQSSLVMVCNQNTMDRNFAVYTLDMTNGTRTRITQGYDAVWAPKVDNLQ